MDGRFGLWHVSISIFTLFNWCCVVLGRFTSIRQKAWVNGSPLTRELLEEGGRKGSGACCYVRGCP